MPVVMWYPIADEITIHPDLQPNPDNGLDDDDDDVDSLDVVPESGDPAQPVCPFWYFTADHEATNGLDPGDIYEVTAGGGFVRVIDEATNLGISEETDIDAFEFVFSENPQGDPPVLAPSLMLLYSVDENDSLTPIDESGGLDPRAVYGSFLTGYSFLVIDPNHPDNVPHWMPDDIDGLTIWNNEIHIPKPNVSVADSIKTHGSGVGPMRINLYPNYYVESRSAELGTLTTTNMLIEVQFDMPIVLLGLTGGDVLSPVGVVAGTVQTAPNTIQVSMTGVPFYSKYTLSFPGVAAASMPGPVTASSSTLCVGVLVGDYDQGLSGLYQRTNYQDFSKIKLAGYINQLANTVDKARADFDCSGRPNYQDFSKVKLAGQINKGIIPCP